MSSEGGRPRRRSNAVERRPLRFWEPFNIWWRAELERTGKRATSEDINRWYTAQSSHAWGPEKPSLQETRTHAKCLRSVSSVRDYFREYRAKKKHEQSEMDMDDEDEAQDEDEELQDRRRRSSAKRASGSRSKPTADTHSTAAYADASGAMQSYVAYSNEEGYWGSYYEQSASGVTTAAAAGATSSQGHAGLAQDMAGYAHYHPAFDMAGVHPGAWDAAWAVHQPAQAAAAATAVTTQGPVLPSEQAMQATMSSYQAQQPYAAGAAAAADTAARAPSGYPSAVAAAAAEAGREVVANSSQQQQQEAIGLSRPTSGAPPGRTSLSSLLSPGLQQFVASLAFQTEMPALSPRPRQDSAQGSPRDRHQQGLRAAAAAAAEGSEQHDVAKRAEATAGACEAQHAQSSQQQAAQMSRFPLWDMADQQRMLQQQYHAAPAEHGYFWPAVAAGSGLGGLKAATHPMQQQRQRSSPEGPEGTQDWLHRQLRAQHRPSTTATADTPATDHHSGGGHASGQGNNAALDDTPAAAPASFIAGHADADAPASAPQASSRRHTVPLFASAGNEHHRRPDVLEAAAACAGGPAAGQEPPASRPPPAGSVIPASLLAAVPLPAATPGCPAFGTIDSILQQLEAGRSPRGFPDAGSQGQAGRHGGAEQQQGYMQPSTASMLEALGVLADGVAMTRGLSQSLDLTLPQHRMSLYAMGSGMLDMLADGMDLDTFLGGAADHGLGPPGGGAGSAGDAVVPVAPGSRASIWWLRASHHMQLPEHWQQHAQALQAAPFRGDGSAPAAAAAAGHTLLLGRTSSTGLDALAAAAAALVAGSESLLLGPPGTMTAQPPPAVSPPAGTEVAAQSAPEGGESGTGRSLVPEGVLCSAQDAVPSTGAEHKRARGSAAGSGQGASRLPSDDSGTPGPDFKRARAAAAAAAHTGLGVAVDASPLASAAPEEGSRVNQQPAFKYFLDLATPKAAPAPQTAHLQQQQQPDALPANKGNKKKEEEEEAAACLLPAPQPLQCSPPHNKRSVVLDLRPEDLGATSENTLATPQTGTAQPQLTAGAHTHAAMQANLQGHHQQPRQQQEQQVGVVVMPQQKPVEQEARTSHTRGQALHLGPLLSPASAAAGGSGLMPPGAGTSRGVLHCGPATAASTTGVAPTGPDGAALPAPAMAHVAAMAAAMAAQGAAAVRPPLRLGQQQQQGGDPDGAAQQQLPTGTPDPAKGLLPTMCEIERMI